MIDQFKVLFNQPWLIVHKSIDIMYIFLLNRFMSKTINITDAKIERGDMIVARLAPINKIEEKDIRKTFRLLN